MSKAATGLPLTIFRLRAEGANRSAMVTHGWAAAYAEDVPKLLAEIERLKPTESGDDVQTYDDWLRREGFDV